MVHEIHICSTHYVIFIPFHLLFEIHLSLNVKLQHMIQYLKKNII